MTVQARPLPPWMPYARSQKGVKEIPGRGENPTVVAYFTDAHIPGRWTDDHAWCAAFVGAMLERSGYRSTRSAMARSYERFVACPMQIGAIGVIPRTDDPRFGHTFFVDKFDDHYVWPLGGNQSNEVNVGKPIPRSLVKTFLPPDYVEEMRRPAPVVPEFETTVTMEPTEPETWNDTEERLREDGSRIVTRSDRVERMAKRGGIALLLAQLMDWLTDTIEPLMPMIHSLKPVVAWVAKSAPWIAVLVLAFVVWEVIQIRNARVEDHRTGKTA